MLSSIDCIKDPAVFGLFPEFKTFITKKTARKVQEQMSQIQKHQIRNIVDQIPEEWDFNSTKRDALCSFIVQRAEYVSRELYPQLFDADSNRIPLCD
ncbi:MAG: hypothetical protein LBQ66_07830 [Planctomycetaceae bacterium]|jgi:hypothetical protein|nr:hypothetical protein [Planctomycetaceae bacterium]